MRKLSNKEFADQANKVHNYKYDYSKSIYTGSKDKIEIICQEHGSFWQAVGAHIYSGAGCQKCTTGVLLTQEEFLIKCKKQHGDLYDYTKVVFTGVKHKITIGCPTHGYFQQIAEKHFVCGCQACGGNKRINSAEFVEKAVKIHGSFYDYSLVDYKNNNTKVIIICPEHGKFIQTPHNHLTGRKCIKCGKKSVSIIEGRWLDFMGLPNDAEHRNVSIRIDGKLYRVDGYIPGSNIIYEFLGDYWHGNPSIYDRHQVHPITKKTYYSMFQETVKRIRTLRQHGFKVISIWEKSFVKIIEKQKLNTYAYIRNTKDINEIINS